MKPPAADAPRRLTLADVMLLVAVTAAGLLPLRLMNDHRYFLAADFKVWSHADRFVGEWLTKTSPPLACWTLLGLLLYLRRPRLTRHRLASSPGFLALLGATCAILYRVLFFFAQMKVSYGDPGLLAVCVMNLLWGASSTVAPVILAVWLPLVVAGRWRLRPGWVERFGCLVGVGWIVHFAVNDLFQIVKMLFLV